MKVSIVKVTYTLTTTMHQPSVLNNMLSSREYNADNIIEYFKLYPNVSLGPGFYYNDALALLCSPFCPMTTPDIIKILDFLILKNDINMKSNHDFTPLLAAVKKGDFPLVEYLVSKGAKFIVGGKVISADTRSLDHFLTLSQQPNLKKLVKECIYNEVISV